MALRVVLMGTGEFAVPPFRAILDSSHHVAGILTQPDKVGRGHHRHVNVVKQLGETYNVPVFQPERASHPDSLRNLESLQADVFVVAAYGQILKPQLLAIPRLGAFNLHGSLLPRHRGAAPVQYSIWKGDELAGVTVFRIEPALDSGPMVGKVETPIGPLETSGELMLRLADLSVPLILQVLEQLEAGTAVEELQDPSLVTLAPKICKEDGAINWSETPRLIDCHVRAMQPWPKAATTLVRPGHDDLRCLIHQVQVTEVATAAEMASINPIGDQQAPVPGSIEIKQNRLHVVTGHGLVEVLRIQAEGRKVLTGTDFLNGNPMPSGSRFLSATS